MAKTNKNFNDGVINIASPQQKNGYDCGTYVIMYANNIAENIVNNAVLDKIEVKTDVTATRKWIYNHIMEKKELLVGKKKNVNRKENKNKKHMAEVDDYTLKTDDVC